MISVNPCIVHCRVHMYEVSEVYGRLLLAANGETEPPLFHQMICNRVSTIHPPRNLRTKLVKVKLRGIRTYNFLVVHTIYFYFVISMLLQQKRLMMSSSMLEGRRRSHNSIPQNLSWIRQRKQLPTTTMAFSFLLRLRDQLLDFVILSTFERCTPCARLNSSPTLYDPRILLSCIYSQHFTPGLFPVP